MQFFQVCTDNDILTLDEIEELIEDYKADTASRILMSMRLIR